MKIKKLEIVPILLVSSALLGGCGGDAAAPVTPADLQINGAVIKGPTFGATMTVYSYAGTTQTQIGSCSTTNQSGAYSCTVPGGSVGPFGVVASGGTYCSDESAVSVSATGVTSCGSGAAPKAGGVGANALKTVVAQTTSGTLAPAPITPFTTAATKLAEETGAVTTFVEKYVAIATTYGIDPNPTATPDVSAEDSRIVALLTEIAASETAIETLVENIVEGENPTTGGALETSAAIAATQPDEATSTTDLIVTTGNGEGGTIPSNITGATSQ